MELALTGHFLSKLALGKLLGFVEVDMPSTDAIS